MGPIKDNKYVLIEAMPSREYKQARTCECGYTTSGIRNWSQHMKHCKLVVTSDMQRIASLEKQLAVKDEQMREQLAAKDEILNQLIQNANNEILSLRKSQAARNRRTKMPEPKRRKIAASQEWKCANPDGKCTLKECELQEYDVDHIIPLLKGGVNAISNMQALCPACHRRKTENDVHTISI